MNLKGWDWLADLKKLAVKEEIPTEDKAKEKESEKNTEEEKIPPNHKYVADIIAGRPVFSHPSRIGGHRIRYGRSRNTGLAAGGFHPATMYILDRFVAIGTQLRTERPGKSTSICPVSSIEPPIIKLENGDVVRVTSASMAHELFPKTKQILFLGDILFGFGEFSENNHKLIPSGYVEEWWVLELEQALQDQKEVPGEIKQFLKNPFEIKPTAEEALHLSETYKIPLHPAFTDFWGNLTVEELKALRDALMDGYDKASDKLNLGFDNHIKKILEKAFVPHRLMDDKIIFSSAMNHIYIHIFNLQENPLDSLEKVKDVFDFFSQISGITIKNKAPYFMGTRMGRPEKSERKSMKGIHTLFPLSDKVGNSRAVEKAIELGKIKIEVCRKKCMNCGKVTLFHQCPQCGSHTEFQKICENCKKLFPMEEENCSQCGRTLKYSSEAIFNFKNHINLKLKETNQYIPKKFKGIFGLTNELKVPEPIEKGILRAKNKVLVYKTAEIRYDATDIPLTHFKPKEIGVSTSQLKNLGYTHDYKGQPISRDDQIIELKVQDILLSEDCANYFLKVANFLDDELEYFYDFEPFYNISEKKDLIGHLVVGLAPHTSAGVIGRIIGFSPARSIYAHPYWHAAKRRNCDGDEDGIMLLLDPLLNFSRHYLPSKIGGRMDATLVIGTLLDPNEVDVEAHNVDTLYKYPLEFYEATYRYASPSELEDQMRLVKKRLGSPDQFQDIGFNIPTDDINEGPTMTAYKTHESMDEKIEAQLHLARIIKSVEAKKVAEKILTSHFNPDILGNLRKFAVQGFRCVKCNTKYRRPPLANSGKCTKCNNKVILTVNRGGIEKYIPRALKICNDFKLDKYTLQRMELIEEYVQSLANNPKIKQQKLSDFF